MGEIKRPEKKKKVWLIAISLVLVVAISGVVGYTVFLSQIPSPIILAESTVFEGTRSMSILSNGNVICYSVHYYPGSRVVVKKEGHISKEEIDALLRLFSNLSEYNEYTVNASEQLIKNHMDCIFDPIGGGTKISCVPLNKTLKIVLFPSSSKTEEETITRDAKEILERIDKIFREAKVSRRETLFH